MNRPPLAMEGAAPPLRGRVARLRASRPDLPMRCPACPVPPGIDCRHDDVSPNACRLVVREAGRRDGVVGGFWTDKVLLASAVHATERQPRNNREATRMQLVVRVERPRPTARQSLDRLAIVKQCEHRTLQGHCGCSGVATCALGKGRGGQVSIQECMECVAEKGGAG
jgi:hypothetical protein